MKLEATDLSCARSGHPVFDGVSFAIDAGDLLILTGPNGAGKSSLLRLVAGLGKPDGGVIRRDGEDIAEDPAAHARALAYVGHLDALKPSLTVTENLVFWTRLHGRDDADAAVARAVGTLGLGPLRDTPARYLSAGQRRRAALCRALASGADLWLLDEPTTALDRAALVAMEAALGDHRARGGMALVSSHVPVGVDGRTLDLGAAS